MDTKGHDVLRGFAGFELEFLRVFSSFRGVMRCIAGGTQGERRGCCLGHKLLVHFGAVGAVCAQSENQMVRRHRVSKFSMVLTVSSDPSQSESKVIS